MIRAPVELPLLVFLALLLGIFIVLVELRVLAFAYRRIGVQPRYVFALLILTLLGSRVNIPQPREHRGAWRTHRLTGGAGTFDGVFLTGIIAGLPA